MDSFLWAYCQGSSAMGAPQKIKQDGEAVGKSDGGFER